MGEFARYRYVFYSGWRPPWRFRPNEFILRFPPWRFWPNEFILPFPPWRFWVNEVILWFPPWRFRPNEVILWFPPWRTRVNEGVSYPPQSRMNGKEEHWHICTTKILATVENNRPTLQSEAWDGNAMGIYQKDPYLQTMPQFKIRQFYHLGLSMTFQNQQVFVTGYKIVCTNRLCQWQEIQVFGISYRPRGCLLNIRTEAKAVNQIQQVCNFGGIRISTDFFSFINIRILVDKIVFEKDLFCPLINR